MTKPYAKPAWPASLKKTRPRVQIWAVLCDAIRPLTAAEIEEELMDRGQGQWLSTIYRTLEKLELCQAVVKACGLADGMAVYELHRGAHRHYAVCLDCHKMVPLKTCPLREELPALCDSGFHVTGHKVAMYGYCYECEKNQS